MAEIVREQAEYVKRSNVSVDVDSRFPWVDIEDNSDAEFAYHLEGDEAENFIKEARRLWNEADDVSWTTACYAAAKPYVESWA